jgi:AcrR family transcriptional regulator
MLSKRKVSPDPSSTEEKIKEAARKVFIRKGYAAARTRDIAEEAGINLALLNYYFRSKQKLFDEVMKEKIQTLLKTIIPVLQDTTTTLDEKIKIIVFNYLKVLAQNNDLPIFVLSELSQGSVSFISKLPPGKIILQSSFMLQLKQRKKNVDPIQFLISMLALIIFPFVAKPLLTQSGLVNEKKFQSLVKERELLIPLWMDAILN